VLEFGAGIGIIALLALCLGAVVYYLVKGVLLLVSFIRSLFPAKEEDPDYLEHYTTDGRPREEAFPPPQDSEPA